ncbi:ABC transporter ATP-binding protein [Brevibacterium litoralis]|uniref:ABC transporter ATP-binding protein n=1 Tax=Brevibacterium litoralis TaxID=3138935 RepID=UPI0032F010E2
MSADTTGSGAATVPTPAGGQGPVLSIRDLDVSFATDGGQVHAVDHVSLEVSAGEVLAIVGESGSGKSVTAKTVLGLLPETATAGGAVVLKGTDVLRASGAHLRAMRGTDVSMVFQEPSTALNPVYTVGWQIAEGLRAHGQKIGRKQMRAKVVAAMEQVGIPDAQERHDYYPHQFSGGQKQRIVIAMALALGADVIVADEPTTALDVTVQAEILDLLRDLRDRTGTAIILITHNMGVVADLADRVAVMYRGDLVEVADAQTLFSDPQADYTKQLLAAVPRLHVEDVTESAPAEELDEAGKAPVPEAPATAGAPDQGTSAAGKESAFGEVLVKAEGMEVTFGGGFGKRPFRAVKGVDFEVRAGEVFGLVGESGSGKTTIGRAIAGLGPATGGSLRVFGHEMVGFKERHFKPERKRIGFVFQDPAASFDPHMTIGECIAEPLVVHRPDMSEGQRRHQVAELLDAVQLPTDYAARYPHELSGGQRQRCSLARGIALEPELVVADEPTSALDVSVQAAVLDLFTELQERYGFAAVFISHDLAVVDMLADRIGVLYHGEMLEQGTNDQVLRDPVHDYTRRLIASLPVPDPALQAERREVARKLRGDAIG